MAQIKLSAPWEIYYKELSALFAKDDEVHVIYDRELNEVKLYVEAGKKAEALALILPSEKRYGAVQLKVTVVPANGAKMEGAEGDLYQAAFEGNGALSYIHTVHGILTNDLTYVVFKPEIVQYFTDDLGDINGFCSTLYQDIARDVFEDQEGVFFCTDRIRQDGALEGPATQWP